eukprot:gnl/MRDRNA2_/MRDRNA2_93157_c0_seq1.p1 gnl/MRDRNA2_/MRDRNA2_93157_c0~~gnl/MRDRNA2_/MRDRNA2_93157_c0_seq1.p1  ORF type:complete len:391 (-),score=69.41 gnl/MRDRNA2_/MRDRNA2_93157_c0_seq1:439-1611(-)
MTMFATHYACEMNACSNYHSVKMNKRASEEDVPSLDDLLAEVNAAFECPCKLGAEKERPTTSSTQCSATSGWASIPSSRPTTTTSSTSQCHQVMKLDWNFPGSIDDETSVTVAKSLRVKPQESIVRHASTQCREPVHSYCPPPRETTKTVTAVCMAPEMINVEGVWFSNGGRSGVTVELMVSGDTVTWPSGAHAKLVARHEQFWLTSATGKLFVSANVSEDGNGDLYLQWTDGSIWSREPIKDAKIEEQLKSKNTRTVDSESTWEKSVSKAPRMLHKIQKTFGALKDKSSKSSPGRKASISEVQGKWIIESASGGQVEVVVDGSSVSWSTGSEAMLVAKNGQFMLTNQSGKIYLTGESTTRGALCWTNGSVWKRSAQWAKDGMCELSEQE